MSLQGVATRVLLLIDNAETQWRQPAVAILALGSTMTKLLLNGQNSREAGSFGREGGVR